MNVQLLRRQRGARLGIDDARRDEHHDLHVDADTDVDLHLDHDGQPGDGDRIVADGQLDADPGHDEGLARGDPFDPAFDDELEQLYDGHRRDRQAHRQRGAAPRRRPRPMHAGGYRDAAVLDEPLDTGLAFTYQGSRHERAWIHEALDTFVHQGVITDVLRLAKGGKEATVYICAANPGLGVSHLAAKIYRPRKFRSLRNDALYRTGRKALDADGKLIKDSRAVHAMRKGTDFGKTVAHTSWLAHELGALRRLHAAGVDVPRPFATGPNVILMAYVGDAAMPAPTLSQVALAPREAAPLFRRVVDNIERMLAERCIHGDLSAFNILYWQGAITLIDFPQVVDPFDNPAGRAIFDRDVARVCGYFAGQGVDADPAALAAAIWERHVPADLWEGVPLTEAELAEMAGVGRG